ncbi:hypothetical protein TK5_25670 [Sideroxyarcus sp. TK5]
MLVSQLRLAARYASEQRMRVTWGVSRFKQLPVNSYMINQRGALPCVASALGDAAKFPWVM